MSSPTAPLLPRSQPPRPNPSQVHSSPVVSVQQRSIPLHKQPSEPLFSEHIMSVASGSGSNSKENRNINNTDLTSNSSESGPSSKRLITPTTSGSNSNFTLGPAFSAKEVGVGNQQHPLSKQGLTASSSTSVSGLLSSGLPNPNGNSTLHTPINYYYNNTTSVNNSVNQTPQTGASKMAAAAKRGLDGLTQNTSSSSMNLIKIQQDEFSNQEEKEEEEENHPLSEKKLKEKDYQTIHTLNRLFHLPCRWKLIRPLGQGAYGLVINVQDSYSGELVAVKCITRVFDKIILARRALREITLLRHFGGHENLTGLIDLDNVWEGYNEIYLYMEPMEADLHQIVRSGQALSNSHIQYFLYQLLRGMKYIHTANVIHRDLKPGNLLVNSDCELKICDFGLARGFKPVTGEDDQNADSKLTEYVATRWYRAPEIMLSNKRYTTAIDVWSIGCILAELLGGKPLFKGKDYVDQLNLILGVLGTPDEETLARVSSDKALTYLKTLPFSPRVDFVDLFPEADPEALNLLSLLLAFDPAQRIDVTQALSHPYLATYHDELDEPACPEIFSKWEQVESLTTIEELREAITKEIEEFRAEVRNMDDEEYYDEEGSGEGGETWRVDGLEDGEQVNMYASPMPDTHLTQNIEGGLPIPASEFVGTSRDTSPKANFSPLVSSSPLAKRQSIIAATVSPERRKSSIGLSASRPRTRDASPITPATALSEESFGNPFSAGTSGGRQSRRQSGNSMSFSMSGGNNRRPNSFLFNPFGQGMTPMPSSIGNQQNSGDQNVNINTESGHSRERGGSGHWNNLNAQSGRRSRAPSQSGSISHLIRKLSSVDLISLNNENHHGHNYGDGHGHDGEEIPPMTVSPSDAPASEVPKNF